MRSLENHVGNDGTPSRTIVVSNCRFANATCIQSVRRTNKMRLSNIVHLTREHHFNITRVPLHTEHYILTNTRIAICFKACSRHINLTDPKSTQLNDAFIGHARQRHYLTGCSKTRTVGARSVRARCERSRRSSVQCSLRAVNEP